MADSKAFVKYHHKLIYSNGTTYCPCFLWINSYSLRWIKLNETNLFNLSPGQINLMVQYRFMQYVLHSRSCIKWIQRCPILFNPLLRHWSLAPLNFTETYLTYSIYTCRQSFLIQAVSLSLLLNDILPLEFQVRLHGELLVSPQGRNRTACFMACTL